MNPFLRLLSRFWRARLLAALLAPALGRAATWYVAPTGSDTAAGTEAAPFATLMRAQTAAAAGDTVYLRGGTYNLSAGNIVRTDGTYAYVNDFTKGGINYWAFPGETPIFDFANVKPADRRVTAFFVRTNNLHFKGFHVVGVQVTITSSQSANTQSECFRLSNGSNNTLEQLTMRDGMGIGVYLINGSANNLILNCDAYNNRGLDSSSIGNVDGFGAHTNASGTGNVFRGCRAWLNSDDGYDLINCFVAATFENCWAFFNGYLNAALATGGDGNGFKAGGYGAAGGSHPAVTPRHVVKSCLAVRNRASGFYANHHPGGIDWLNNTAYQNATNYNMLNTLSDNDTDVPGYGHYMRNNLGFSPRSTSLSNLNQAESDVSFNFFTLPVTVTAADFVSVTTNTTQLLQLVATPRQADGSLPVLALLHLANDSDVRDQGVDVGLPFTGAAPDLGCFEHPPVAAPANLTATPGSRTVTLAWTAAPHAATYTVWRSAASGSGYVALNSTVAATSLHDTGLANGATYYYVVTAANAQGSSPNSAEVAATPRAPTAAWLAAHFPGQSDPAVVGLAADPDGDSYANLLEYFLGTDPAAPDAAGLVTLTEVGAGEFTLRFRQAKNLPDLTYTIQESGDLRMWTDTGVAGTVEADLGESHLLRAVLARGSAARIYWRLRVTLADE